MKYSSECELTSVVFYFFLEITLRKETHTLTHTLFTTTSTQLEQDTTESSTSPTRIKRICQTNFHSSDPPAPRPTTHPTPKHWNVTLYAATPPKKKRKKGTDNINCKLQHTASMMQMETPVLLHHHGHHLSGMQQAIATRCDVPLSAAFSAVQQSACNSSLACSSMQALMAFPLQHLERLPEPRRPTPSPTLPFQAAIATPFTAIATSPPTFPFRSIATATLSTSTSSYSSSAFSFSPPLSPTRFFLPIVAEAATEAAERGRVGGGGRWHGGSAMKPSYISAFEDDSIAAVARQAAAAHAGTKHLLSSSYPYAPLPGTPPQQQQQQQRWLPSAPRTVKPHPFSAGRKQNSTASSQSASKSRRRPTSPSTTMMTTATAAPSKGSKGGRSKAGTGSRSKRRSKASKSPPLKTMKRSAPLPTQRRRHNLAVGSAMHATVHSRFNQRRNALAGGEARTLARWASGQPRATASECQRWSIYIPDARPKDEDNDLFKTELSKLFLQSIEPR